MFILRYLLPEGRREENALARVVGVFTMTLRPCTQLALRAAPSYESFTAALVSREGDELKEGFISGIHRDLGVYLPAMERQLAILDALYEEYNLESDEVV